MIKITTNKGRSATKSQSPKRALFGMISRLATKAKIADLSKKVDKKARHLLRLSKIRLSSLQEDERNHPCRYIFHHIPKCGGTSAVDALSNWIVLIKDYPKGRSDQATPMISNRFCDNPVELAKLRNYQALVGHHHIDRSCLHQRYPQSLTDKRFRIFTFLRHPLELQISDLLH